MSSRETGRSALRDRRGSVATQRVGFYALVVVLLVVAVGHLYAIRGLTTLHAGLPLWLWIQLVVLAAMLVVAYVAVGLWTDAVGDELSRSDATEEGR